LFAFGFAPSAIPGQLKINLAPPTVPWAARWQALQIPTLFQDSRGPPRPTGINSCGSSHLPVQTFDTLTAKHTCPSRSNTRCRSSAAGWILARCFLLIGFSFDRFSPAAFPGCFGCPFANLNPL